MLKPGALVGVIAPAGPSSAERREKVEPLLARHGLRARLYPSCFLDTGYLAGPDAQRLADLHAAFDDDEVAAIICLRGGYGCGRLLAGADTALLRRKPKLLAGYSDITALHALLATLGIPSLHAPMLGSDLAREDRAGDEAALFDLLRNGLRAGDVLQPALLAESWHAGGVAEGRLIGGNLSLVASLLGTPWAYSLDDAILFLEDVSEQLYRVDRLLGQLKNAGVLDAVKGVVVGSFTEEESPEAVLKDYLLPLAERGKPVLTGWPAGHGTPNLPLPLGVRARLDAGAGSLTMLGDFLVG
jgi:muramoyltetrapeptide carboxypeptidase